MYLPIVESDISIFINFLAIINVVAAGDILINKDFREVYLGLFIIAL